MAKKAKPGMTRGADDGRKNETEPPKKTRSVEMVSNDVVATGYANHVRSQLSPWDVRLRFAEIIDAADDKLLVREFANIVMSPQHAKSLSKLLERQIANYENRFGAIPWPKEEDPDIHEE